MKTVATTFPGAQGEPLAARLELPAGAPRAFALFAHCFTCGKESAAAVKVSRALAARGIAVLRFDFTGLGGSGGDFANANFSSNTQDLVAAADYLRTEHQAPALLIGHSLGGAAVLAAAERIPEARAIATIAAPSDPAHVEHVFAGAAPDIEAGEAAVTLGGRKFTIRRQFLEDIREQPQLERVSKLRRALLVLHAPSDEVVGVENAARIFLAAKHPKSFVSLADADHFLKRGADADYAASVIACWAERYLPQSSAAEEGPEGVVIVEETRAGRFQQRVRIGAHEFFADEPKSVGGDATGPTPYDLVAAGLGACKSMTMRLYAERQGWSVDAVRVRATHDRIHAADCADCETKEGRIDEFRVEIAVEGGLDADEKARLVAIAERCPVHQTLTGEVKIRATA